MSNTLALFSCLLMLAAVERSQSNPAGLPCVNIKCPDNCPGGQTNIQDGACSHCACGIFSCEELKCDPGQSCQLLPQTTCTGGMCITQNQAVCVGACPDLFHCDLVCPYGAAFNSNGCMDSCGCVNPCPSCDKPNEQCLVRELPCASGSETGCYMGICAPQSAAGGLGAGPVLPIPSNSNGGPSVNPPATVPTVPGVNPPVTGSSVPAVNPPVTGSSVPAVNPPVTGPSVPALNPPVTGPSVPALNPPVTGPAAPAVNPTIPAGGGGPTVEMPATTGGM